jgi:hypothetical protein
VILRRSLIILWRFLIFLLIAGLTYVSVFVIFPFIDTRSPIVFAILIFYAVLAYVLIPFAIRIIRLAFRANHVPTHVTTRDGWASDPINVAFTVRNKKHLIRAMESAGWHIADKGTLKNDIREGVAILLNRPYPSAPCSKLYMFSRPQDIAFQIPVDNSPRIRHHVRFWKVEPKAIDTTQHKFWLSTLRRVVGIDRELWVGAATFDKRVIGIRWRTLQLTHHIEADTNIERDYLISTLANSGYVRNQRIIKSGEAYKFRGQNLGVTIVNDGYTKLLELRSAVFPRRNHRRSDDADTK